MIDCDYIKCGDSYKLIKTIPDKSIDLIITDPPYKFIDGGGGGAFGSKKRNYHQEYTSLYKQIGNTKETERIRIKANSQRIANNLRFISKGFDISLLDEFCRILKKINIYIWCSKSQLGEIITYFERGGCTIDLLTWHKTNPTPMCNNTYLSDTEYCIFAREKGVKLYGTYHTKKKYYVSKANVFDKKLYNHPTIKPLEIIQNLIINSSNEGDIVFDPFLGSGTTSVASINTNRHYIGFELDENYFKTAQKRINAAFNNTITTNNIITNTNKKEKENFETLFDLIKKEDKK